MFYSLATNQLHRDKFLPVRLCLIAGAVLAGSLFFGIDSALAATIPTGELIKNGFFGDTTTNTTGATASFEFWTKTVNGIPANNTAPGRNNDNPDLNPINARGIGSAINIANGNAGFGSFFTSTYAVLGDLTGNIGATIPNPDLPNSGMFSIFQDFTLDSKTALGENISGYDLNFSLTAVFDGRDSVSALINDIFSVTLINLDDSSKNVPFISRESTGLPNNCGPRYDCLSGNQINFDGITNPNSFTLSNLIPGKYRLELTLNERATTITGTITDTAVGIDNVSLKGDARLAASPTIPEPSLPLLLGFAMALLGWSRRFTAK